MNQINQMNQIKIKNNLTKELIDRFGLSKYSVAKKCGVTWATVQYWYRGTFDPVEENMKKLDEMVKGRETGRKMKEGIG